MKPIALSFLLLICASACRERMHPSADEVNAPIESPPPPPPKAPPPTAANKVDKTATPEKTNSESSSQPPASSVVTTKLGPDGKEITDDGYQVVRGRSDAQSSQSPDVSIKAPDGWTVASPPTTPDPHGGKFSLTEALKGLPPKGTLAAAIKTSLGTFQCDLYEDKAPLTVANFVGLARGLRKFWSAKDHAWVNRPYYDGTIFHRVIPGFMIQGGDWKGDGSGGMYYTIPDELDPSLKHDRGGLLCMANRGPNTNEAQFFLTETAAAHLDTSYTIFGLCSPTELVYRIARVPQSGPPKNRPLTPVVIERVTITRRSGPAAKGGNTSANTPLPRNETPGVVPPGRAVQINAPK
jgi:peptidyl-prolyl cis-trans isomerase A (cyclophilin A)